MSQPLLRFDITKKYQGFALECEASFQRGITAVFGPSGSGKTTLLDCIAGLVRPDRGEIEVEGQVIFSSSARTSVPPEKRRFGYVFQDSALFPHMTVRDNVQYGYKLTPPELRSTSPDRLVDLLHLGHLINRKVRNLSGGERQRVALARALAASPRLLLLDEPLASLDMGFRGVIIRYLKRISRELGTPMIYVSHSISEVMALADDALVLANGRLVVQGRPSVVLAHPGLARLAEFATLENLLEAQVVSRDEQDGLAELAVGSVRLLVPDVRRQAGESVMASIRAGDIILALEPPPRMSARNVIEATVQEIHWLDHRVLVYVDVGTRLVVEITRKALAEMALAEGQRVHLVIKTNSIVVMDAPESITQGHNE